jgi:hypothetical protein
VSKKKRKYYSPSPEEKAKLEKALTRDRSPRIHYNELKMVPLTEENRRQFHVRNTSAPEDLKIIKISTEEEAERKREAKLLVKRFIKEKNERMKEKEQKDELKRKKMLEMAEAEI